MEKTKATSDEVPGDRSRYRKEAECQGEGREGDNEDQLTDVQKAVNRIERERLRKARNQRRYYNRHKVEEQAKARVRAAKNRALAQDMWISTVDESNNSIGSPIDVRRPSPSPSSAPPAPHSLYPTSSSFSNASIDSPNDFRPPSQSSFLAFHPLWPTSSSLSGDVSSHDGLHLPIDTSIDLNDFLARDIRGRLAFTRRVLLRMETELGTTDQWANRLAQDWVAIQNSGREVVKDWLSKSRSTIQLARRLILFLGYLMEDTGGSLTMEECRDLWIEANHLSATVYKGVFGMELRLDLALEQYISMY